MSLGAARELPAEVYVEPMTRRHIEPVMAIESACFPKPWSLSIFISELAMPATRAYFVAKVGAEIVGYAGMLMAGDECHLTTIAVLPERQNRSIAKHLLLEIHREAIRRGARAITLEVRVSNLAGQTLYKTFGYRPVGVRKNYYIETREDALIMWVRGVDRPEHTALLDTVERRLKRPAGTGRWRRHSHP